MSNQKDKWQVKKYRGKYIVRGQAIEEFAERTDFNNGQAVQRLRDIMRRMGIIHELSRRGIKAGNTVQVGEDKNVFNY